MKTSPTGIDLIKESEGFRSEAYLCPAGVWTIGFGTIRHANGERVEKGETTTEEEATADLAYDVGDAERVIKRNVIKPLNQNQFDALVSFVYNVGAANFIGSTLIRLLNQGNYAWAAEQFDRWTYANKVKLPGLVTRRAAERALFLKGV